MNPDWIAPSILAADFARLGEEVGAVVDAGANLIHFDVMDNHYVPNLTIGPAVCASLRRYMDRHKIEALIDAHLMIAPVDALIPRFAEAGAAIISVHPEATADLEHTLTLIRSSGCQAGVVFNPETTLDGLPQWIDKVDLVLVMSVHPGFGGQAFIESSVQKVAAARRMIDAAGCNARLEVDGGLSADNVGSVAAAGADTFVAGSAIFGTENYRSTITAMRRAIDAARPR